MNVIKRAGRLALPVALAVLAIALLLGAMTALAQGPVTNFDSVTLNRDLVVNGSATFKGTTSLTSVLCSTGYFTSYNVTAGNATVTNTLDAQGPVVNTVGSVTVSDTMLVSNTASFLSFVEIPNGTEAAPSLRFTADTDLGIYRYGANAFGITADDLVVGKNHSFVGTPSVIGGGDSNVMYSKFSVIGGGSGNTITGTDIVDDARYSFLGGGNGNLINSTGDELVLVGGVDNAIQDATDYAFLGAGYSNVISGTANSAVLVGGGENEVSGSWATVPGGYDNLASGDFSFAAGRRAQATSQGAFVWADSTDADFADAGADTFNVRASGGIYGTGPAHLEIGYLAKTGSYAITATDNGDLLSNAGATSEITFTLPSAAVGLNYCIYVYAAYTVTVLPASGDQIHHLTNGATNRIQNVGTVGDNVCLTAIDNTYWLPVPTEEGTWSDID